MGRISLERLPFWGNKGMQNHGDESWTDKHNISIHITCFTFKFLVDVVWSWDSQQPRNFLRQCESLLSSRSVGKNQSVLTLVWWKNKHPPDRPWNDLYWCGAQFVVYATCCLAPVNCFWLLSVNVPQSFQKGGLMTEKPWTLVDAYTYLYIPF